MNIITIVLLIWICVTIAKIIFGIGHFSDNMTKRDKLIFLLLYILLCFLWPVRLFLSIVKEVKKFFIKMFTDKNDIYMIH